MNDKATYINKDRILPESQDYKYLREKGIEYIQELASVLWTDYNYHDPGITILENLCYAITELGYRTGFMIQDILTEGGSSSSPKQFFTAREILTCNPVTVNDFRKILIDIEGIKNAWLKPAENVLPQIYVDCKKSMLTTNSGVKNAKPLNLRGLYNVYLEMEEDDELGDLNIYCYERNINSPQGSFQIEVVLPSWDKYFNEPVLPEEFSIINISSMAGSQKYNCQLKAKYGSNHRTYNCVIISKGIKTSGNEILIEKELNRTDKDSLLSLYLGIITKAVGYAKLAYSSLQAHRDLCEDFYSINGIDIEEIAVCADIDITPESDPVKILAEVYYQIERFLDPRVNFYSLKELINKGKKTVDIFVGPPLKHGFIDDDELDNSDFKTVIHVSDIIQILMDIDGVVAVKNLMLSSLYNCEVETESEKWCLKIPEHRAVRLCLNNSTIAFYKGFIPYYPNQEETLGRLKELEALERYKRLAKGEYDIKIPPGKNRNIEDYYSIQNDFPLCYSVGEEGLALSAGSERKAQAKQLKAYLLFYDQVLANYFSQLAHTKDLFSLNPDIKKTYFAYDFLSYDDEGKLRIPGLPPLLKDFVDTLNLSDPLINIDNFSTYKTKWESFINDSANNSPSYSRKDLLESQTVYEDRRNRFLDHLMARFAEQFTNYVMLMYTLEKKKAPSALIEDKIAFLKDYPEISSTRGRAFNYKDASGTWNTNNVSGLKKRVSRLLGIDSYDRKSLSDCIEKSFEVYQEKDTDNIDEYRFRLIDDKGNILLSSSTHYLDKSTMRQEIRSVIKFGRFKNYYKISTTKNGRYYFNLLDDTGEVIARRIEYFATQDELNSALDIVIKYLDASLTDCEGFHIIEHILLRPRSVGEELLAVCVDKNCTNCKGFIDPYSFRITVVAPYWPERFQNMDFRKYFESTVRMEAPAHVHAKICWVDEKSMADFENKYRKWLKEMSKEYVDQSNLAAAQKAFILSLESLRSVYPETRLYDCKKENQDNVLLLNYSVLGSTSEE